MSKQENVKDFLDMSSITKTVLLENEKKTNQLITMVEVAACVIMLVHIILRTFVSPDSFSPIVAITLGIVLVINIVTIIITQKLKYKKLTKYVLIGLMIFTAISLKLYLGNFYNLWVIFPIVLASTYNNKRISLGSSIITIVMFYAADVVNILMQEYDDFNILVLPKDYQISLLTGFDRNYFVGKLEIAGTLKNYLGIYVPTSLFILIVLAFGCYIFAKRNYENLIEQAKSIEEKRRVDEELILAKDIQTTMIPLDFDNINTECENVDLYGLMLAAEDISSDVYDFFMIDKNQLCLFIGETSQRGAMPTIFMNNAKDYIEEHAKEGQNVSEILQGVNNYLCESNSANIYMSAWIGILDLETGQMQYSSASQNQQYKSTNKTFAHVSQTGNDMLIGVIENVQYESNKLAFEKGDKLFLYTDGVISGTNGKKEFYGKEKLLACINKNINLSAQELLINVQNEILEFVVEGEQTDDITMLCIEYK